MTCVAKISSGAGVARIRLGLGTSVQMPREATLVSSGAPRVSIMQARAANLRLVQPKSCIETRIFPGFGAKGDPGPQGPPGPSGSEFVTDKFTADSTAFSNRGVYLSAVPADPLKVEFAPQFGIEQTAGIDFVVTGNFLSWADLALELLLDAGSAFSVRYQME